MKLQHHLNLASTFRPLLIPVSAQQDFVGVFVFLLLVLPVENGHLAKVRVIPRTRNPGEMAQLLDFTFEFELIRDLLNPVEFLPGTYLDFGFFACLSSPSSFFRNSFSTSSHSSLASNLAIFSSELSSRASGRPEPCFLPSARPRIPFCLQAARQR